MKQCPNCKNTYTDDSLQFCLTDGASLIKVPDAAETVRMSFGGEPMRVNISPQDSVPTFFAPPQSVSQEPPPKKLFGLIIAAIAAVFLLLAIAGVAGFILFRQTGSENPVASVSPTPFASPSAAPNEETERLKKEMADLKKQMEEQKNQKQTDNLSDQKTNVPTVNVPPPNQQKTTTARANSPNDGFLALRSEPSSETGYRITKIPHGATLTVLGCPKSSNAGKMPGRWCQVIYNGQSGWAFDAYMIF